MSIDIDRSLILNKLKNHYGFNSDSEFANFLGIKPQTLSSWHSRNSFDINLLYAKCVDVDGNFLLTGKGEIEKQKIQEKCSKEMTTKKTTFSPKTKSVKNVVNLESSESGIPLIPIDAFAGFGAGDVSVMEYEVGRYVVPEFTELKVDFMIQVKGSSMQPKYNSGDIVACRKLYLQDAFFQWNKVYVLDTEQGALVKRLREGKEKGHLLIVSDNPEYPPFELSLSKVRAIALVCGVIRFE